MNLFQRNRPSLIDVSRLSLLIANSDILNDPLAGINLYSWPDANKRPNTSFDQILQTHEFYDASGWSDYIGSRANVPIIIDAYDRHVFMISPAFYRGKRYQLIAGNRESATNFKMMRLKHPCIPQVIPVVADGRVHMLIEPLRRENMVPRLAFLETLRGGDEPAQVRQIFYYPKASQVANALAYIGNTIRFLGNQGYNHPEWEVFLPIPMAINTSETSRSFGNDVYSAAGVGDLFIRPLVRFAASLQWDIADDEKAAKQIAAVQKHSAILDIMGARLKIPAVEQPPEYTLPEAKISSNMANVVSMLPQPKLIYPDTISPVDARSCCILEMLMALLTNGIEPKFSTGNWDDTAHEIILAFLTNLHLYVYMRTPINIYMTPHDMEEYLINIKKNPHMLEKYQSFYQQQVSYLQRHGVETISFTDALAEFSMMYKSSMRSGIKGNISRWSIGEPELPLPSMAQIEGTLLLHGAELDAYQVGAVFYNTPLATAIEYGTKEYDPVWLSANDVLLLQDFLEGRIMLMTLYSELSNPAFNVLLANRSLLDIYEFPLARQALNKIFKLGASAIDQLQAGKDSLTRDSVLRGVGNPVLYRLREIAEML